MNRLRFPPCRWQEHSHGTQRAEQQCPFEIKSQHFDTWVLLCCCLMSHLRSTWCLWSLQGAGQGMAVLGGTRTSGDAAQPSRDVHGADNYQIQIMEERGVCPGTLYTVQVLLSPTQSALPSWGCRTSWIPKPQGWLSWWP